MAKQNISADIIWSPGHHLATHSASLYQSAYDYRAGTNNPRTSLVCQGEVYFFFWLHVQHGLVGRCGGGGVDAAGGLCPSWKLRDPGWRSPHLNTATPAGGDRVRNITRWLLELPLDVRHFHVGVHAIGQSKSCGPTWLWRGLGNRCPKLWKN